MNADLHALTGAYALNAVSDGERSAFERHLPSCPTCTAEVRGFALTTARLGAAFESAPPATLRAKVLAAAASTPHERPANVVRLRREPKHTVATRWLSVAAAVLLVTSGALGITAYSNAQRANELAATATSVAAVLSADDAESARGPVTGGGSGSIVVSRERGEAVVVTSGLGEPPTGTTYQLWAIGADGAESRGLMTPGAGGTAGDVVAWPDDANTFGMTIEPAGGSEQPTTDPILLLELPA